MSMISGGKVTHEWSHQNLWYDTPERISKKSRGNMDGLRFSPIIVAWKFMIVMFYAENFLKKVTFELMLLFFKTWLILILSYILYAFIQSFSITSYFYRILKTVQYIHMTIACYTILRFYPTDDCGLYRPILYIFLPLIDDWLRQILYAAILCFLTNLIFLI